ncbi:MAG: class I tRNA ligase family protein, partial [Holosporales bacterium]|nr:class I tRNA ligase family protein [Holosporales bacterium]
NGLHLKKAREILIERLSSDGFLIKQEEIIHSVPYGDRSGTVIEPLLTNQWFVDVKKLAEPAIKAVEEGKIQFFPAKWVNSYFEWMRNIEPWCISRQIIWGHRIPVWYGPKGEIIVARTEAEAQASAAKLGITADQLSRETDVLDTWFSSALWPFAAFGWPEETARLKRYFPTSVLVTGFDIIFFWIARMIMMSLYFKKEIPFKDIYIHALVRDEKGQKMSKSKGNVLDPMDLINEFGADALRFTLAFMSVPGRDIKFDRENVRISRNFITKIWNAARFMQIRGIKFDQNIKKINTNKRLNCWIIAKLKKLKSNIDDDMKEYRFDYATRDIQLFLRDIFCDFFIETMKSQNDEDIAITAGFVFTEFLKISHPFIPFVVEHLAEKLGAELYDDQDIEMLQTDEKSEKEVDEFIELIHDERSKKQEKRERGGGSMQI